jgi:1,4-alpha-glucan branching enzyme
MQVGTGVQKLAYAASLYQGTYNQWAAANNLTQEPAAAQAILQQVFNLIQVLQPTVTAVAAQVSTVSASTMPSVADQAKTGNLL